MSKSRRVMLSSDEEEEDERERGGTKKALEQKSSQSSSKADGSIGLIDLEMDDEELERVRKEERKQKRKQALTAKNKGDKKKERKEVSDDGAEDGWLDAKSTKPGRAASSKTKPVDKGRGTGKSAKANGTITTSRKKKGCFSSSEEEKSEDDEFAFNSEETSKSRRGAEQEDKEMRSIDQYVRRSVRSLIDNKGKSAKSATPKRKRVLLSESDVDEEDSGGEGGKRSESDEYEEDRKAKKLKKPRKKKSKVGDSSESEIDEATRNLKAARKKSLMKEADLLQATKNAEKEETERRKRLAERQLKFNSIVLEEDGAIAGVLDETGAVKKLKEIILDPDQNADQPQPVAVHPYLVKKLKHHQAEGVSFMYNCTFESTDRLDQPGGGCILAHCMGLGKTLQVIAFLHTVMLHEKVGKVCRRAMIVVPKNVVINWHKEFIKWLGDEDEELGEIMVDKLEDYTSPRDRVTALENWHNSEYPSVMIIGYEMYRNLVLDDEDQKPKRAPPMGKKPPKKKPLTKAKKLQLRYLADYKKYLQDPGPDIVVCDEAHRLKNEDSILSKTMNKIKTKRRICLTGTPLQNNLFEYHVMMNFVKPGILGTKAEFTNRFESIIKRGRNKDATPNDVLYMIRRCHVLHQQLAGCVQRKDYTVLITAIPPKQEYVIKVRLKKPQIDLYRYFIANVSQKKILPDYHALSRVWTHPYQLIVHEQELERKRMFEDDALEDENFIDDEDEMCSTSEENSDARSGSESEGTYSDASDNKAKKNGKATNKEKGNGKKGKKKHEEDESDDDIQILEDISGGRPKASDESIAIGMRRSRRLNNASPELEMRDTLTPPSYSGWFSESGVVSEADAENWALSNKLVLLEQIVRKCEAIGDKLLVFSQSLESLDLIKRMLHAKSDTWFDDGHEAVNMESGEKWAWIPGFDYLIIDGSVQSGKRDNVQTRFNDPDNTRIRLLLISTRAGSLGTNLIAANRVIIFDACWNPSHDTQSLFRVYRFGQEKPVYIYRLVAQGTMEEKIYKRQVMKESTSMRVVDEAQIQRHFSRDEEELLYEFEPNECDQDESLNSSQRPAFAPPKDRLLADVLSEHVECVVDYMQHDTLFVNVEEEKLDENAQKAAWEEYEREKNGRSRAQAMQQQQQQLQLQQQAAYAQQMMMQHAAQLGLGLNAQDNGQANTTMMAAVAQIELHRQLVEAARKKAHSDLTYLQAKALNGIEDKTATDIALLKTSLDAILPSIPERLRGGINDFAPFFSNFIQDGMMKKQTPNDVLNKCVRTFQTVVNLIKTEEGCKTALRQIRPIIGQFFPSDNLEL